MSEQSTEGWKVLKDLAATKAFGAAIAREAPSSSSVLLLDGPLGAGKTSLIKGFALEAGIEEPITSPTFSIAQHYLTGHPPLIHIDLYRLNNTKEANLLFLQEEEEAQAIGAFIAVEWPERLSIEIPDAWRVKLRYHQEKGRIVQLSVPSKEAINNSTSDTLG